MSVSSEITRINNNIAAAYNEAEAKGAAMPVAENSANLADTVASIPTESEPTLITKQIIENGTYDAKDDHADGYSEVTVNVEAPASDAVLEITEETVPESVNWDDRIPAAFSGNGYKLAKYLGDLWILNDANEDSRTGEINYDWIRIASENDIDDLDANKEDVSNKATSISPASTDTQYPSAKAVYDFVDIPSYVKEEAESVLEKAFAHKGLGRTVRFIAVSDAHNDSTETSHSYTRVANKHCGQAIKYIAERIALDFVACLGDSTWAGVAHTTAQYNTKWLEADLQEMNSFLAECFRGVPNIRVVGNHDQCATTDNNNIVSRLQNSGAYQLIGRYNAGVTDAPCNYGYYDIDNVKLRIIYLNTSDTVSTSTQGTLLAVSQEQKNWLCETLIDVNTKSDAARWNVLLLSHAPLDMIGAIDTDILIPYVNGGTYGSYTFTNHSAKIIGNCHGHTHCYNVGYLSDKIRRFTIPNANFYDNNHYKDNSDYAAWTEQTTYPKTENSRIDTSFSLVTLDLDNLICYVDNYGAGYDREFSVDYHNTTPARLLNLDRISAEATTDEMIPLDTTKCYKNIYYVTMKGYNADCVINFVTANSIDLKESGVGGITVGYVVELPDTNSAYTFTCDYAGTGSGRIYYNVLDNSGNLLHGTKQMLNASANESGVCEYTIPAPTGDYKWLVIMLSSNTNGAKTYTNVDLTKNS